MFPASLLAYAEPVLAETTRVCASYEVTGVRPCPKTVPGEGGRTRRRRYGRDRPPPREGTAAGDG
ncbi:hypothetical protein GCM10010233_34640 [Streptomyces pseudogriseolus]|uniref:Uncharacterized protein n=1 Tax=Streptomyces pseudogriseolus TaxID=36817 RepID=A0ABQ2SZZ2_STREZ|nr:hypothetical protein GCM10010233_34640 [Streptomyces gancidicus]GGS44668.1 hypothetical protein GCM10010285_25260 [Streptomyces rubiginosus]